MSITDELREVAVKTECANGRCEKLYRGDLEHIADRIDEAHKHAIGHINDQDPETMAKNGWIKLPVDADGVPIRVGDELDYLEALHPNVPARFKVRNMFYCGNGKWHLRTYPATYDPRKCRHHAPTVEDILREFGDWYTHTKGGCDEDAIVAEYAAKLKLVSNK